MKELTPRQGRLRRLDKRWKVPAAAALLALVAAACNGGDGAGDDLEAAKTEVCQSASQWQTTLDSVSQGDAEPGALSQEVDELSIGVADAADALRDAGADALANAADSLSATVDEISAALDQASETAAELATQAATRLDALTTLAECESAGS